jgi:hypothetical protein
MVKWTRLYFLIFQKEEQKLSFKPTAWEASSLKKVNERIKQ